MSGVFSWMDYSEHDRRRALDFVDQFRDRTTRDELGIGTVRDALSDGLFPGTSTIQTRARYFLLVPWIYRKLEADHASAGEASRLARKMELDLIDHLADGEDTAGVIGIEARRKLKRLPSNIYWQGLFEWGIRRHPAPQATYHRYFSAFCQAADSRKAEDDDEERAARPVQPMWHKSLPAPPDDFPKTATLGLTLDEAQYLQERILTRAAGTMLAFMVAADRPPGDSAFPWEYSKSSAMPTALRSLLDHARIFSAVVLGAALLYNLLVAKALENADAVSDFRSRLEEWAEEMTAMRGELADWNLTDLWREVSLRNNRIGKPTRVFVNQWISLTLAEGIVAGGDATAEASQLVANRERALKGAQSRLLNQRAMELWSGESGTGRLSYRWNRVLSIVRDIHAGIAHA